MADPTGEAKSDALRIDFDRRVMLRFRGSVITSDRGLLAYRELDDALALTASGGERLAEARTGKNRRHSKGVSVLMLMGAGDDVVPPSLCTPNR